MATTSPCCFVLATSERLGVVLVETKPRGTSQTSGLGDWMDAGVKERELGKTSTGF